MFNACLGFERGDNHSQYANFDEENYPMSFNAWYAVCDKWSLSAGYAVYSNFVGQDITVADQTPYTGVRDDCRPADHLAVELRRAGPRRDHRLALRLDRVRDADRATSSGCGATT